MTKRPVVEVWRFDSAVTALVLRCSELNALQHDFMFIIFVLWMLRTQQFSLPTFSMCFGPVSSDSLFCCQGTYSYVDYVDAYVYIYICLYIIYTSKSLVPCVHRFCEVLFWSLVGSNSTASPWCRALALGRVVEVLRGTPRCSLATASIPPCFFWHCDDSQPQVIKRGYG